MKTFNVALLSDDNTMQMSYFFTVKANSQEEAIDLARNNLRGIITDQYGEDDQDFETIESDLNDFTPEIFELIEI
jgi:hypothetical protein